MTEFFDQDSLINLETDGGIIWYSLLEIYTHIKDNFLPPLDKD